MLSPFLQYGKCGEKQCCVLPELSWVKRWCVQVNERASVFLEQGICLSLIGLPTLTWAAKHLIGGKNESRMNWTGWYSFANLLAFLLLGMSGPALSQGGTNTGSELQSFPDSCSRKLCRLRPCLLPPTLPPVTVCSRSTPGAGHVDQWKQCWDQFWDWVGFSNMQVPERTDMDGD